MKKIVCNGINYRKGFIEASGDVHSGFLNIEVWNVAPELDISPGALRFEEIPEEAFVGNTEIELTIENAEELLSVLKDLITDAKKMKSQQNE
jgi:hypothetical protein